MSRNEISKMSVEERIALMEELWASFDRDDLEYPVPQWHQAILEKRINKENKQFTSLNEMKDLLQKELNAYRNS